MGDSVMQPFVGNDGMSVVNDADFDVFIAHGKGGDGACRVGKGYAALGDCPADKLLSGGRGFCSDGDYVTGFCENNGFALGIACATVFNVYRVALLGFGKLFAANLAGIFVNIVAVSVTVAVVMTDGSFNVALIALVAAFVRTLVKDAKFRTMWALNAYSRWIRLS